MKELPEKLRMLNLVDHMDRDIAILCDDKSVVIEGTLYVCLTQEALQKTADALKKKYGRQHGAKKIQLGYVLDNLFYFKEANKLIISGLLPGDIELTREDLEPLREVSENFVYMHESAINRMKVSDAYEKMKDSIVFFQGELPDKSSNNISFSYLLRKDNAGREYKAIKAYLTYEHAIKKNTNKLPISTSK